jgi:hypothetical protein
MTATAGVILGVVGYAALEERPSGQNAQKAGRPLEPQQAKRLKTRDGPATCQDV